MTENVVLDASAILAFLQEENGSEKVEIILSAGRGIISTVNYTEIVGKLLDKGMPETSVRMVMENLELQLEPLDDVQAWEAGLLRIKTKKYGISLADRACLALAQVMKLSVITADQQWSKLRLDINIRQIR